MARRTNRSNIMRRLRAIPKLQMIRPADDWEVKMAWIAALKYKGPTAIVLSRQGLPDLPQTHLPYDQGMAKGAYIIKKESGTPQFTFFATGSEVSLALDVAGALEKRGKACRVVSMPCWELFEAQAKTISTASSAEISANASASKRASLSAGTSGSAETALRSASNRLANRPPSAISRKNLASLSTPS